MPYTSKVLNRGAALVADKRRFFETLEDSDMLPPFFWDKEDAASYLAESDKRIIMCRTLLRSHSGKGIVIARSPEELVDAPLYTAYIRKKAEYRIHVRRWDDEVLIQQKRKRNGTNPEDYSPLIRSYHHGWVYCSDHVDHPGDDAVDMARRALIECGLDFGAVDLVISKGESSRPYVLEINSAPALSAPTTRDFYINGFLSL